jgi:predicted RNA binding protein YcfA (HicA-like mRNA interferase family)
MPKLPRVTGAEAKRASESIGFRVDRIKGSHHILKKAGHRYPLSIPIHGNEVLGVGLLKSLIAAAGITEEQFCELL